LNLVSLGVGAIIGAGIFVVTGHAAAQYAGPAIVLSFVLSAIACGFAGLCYAEFASMIPISGSAYSYAYATLGEFIAWIIGWDLILEYLFGAAAVATSWSGYVLSFLRDFGVVIPAQFTAATGTPLVFKGGSWIEAVGALAADAHLPHMTAVMNLPAALAIAVIATLLVIGIRASARFNNLIVAAKVGVILLFIGVGYFFMRQANWQPFLPENTGKFGEFGWSGILRGAGVIFFAYIGFDAVSTTAQEARDPRKHMPIGILGSLAICTVLYVLVSLVMTGMVKYDQLNVDAPIAVAVSAAGPQLVWLQGVVKFGAIAGLTSVILVLVLGQSRIFYTMASDGLLPSPFARLHSRFKTPHVTTIVTGATAMVVSATVPGDDLCMMVSIGTLLAFVIVCVGVLVLRHTHPQFPRAFRTPWVPVVPILGAALCLVQMIYLPPQTWLRLVIWMGVGFVIYFAFGRRHSRLRLENQSAESRKP
jgi:APA family basic amino acid/polyamine antiporter